MDRVIRDYNKILEAFAPPAKQAKQTGKSIEVLGSTGELTVNALKTLQQFPGLIKTVQLNDMGIYSKNIADLVGQGYLKRVKQGFYRIAEYSENDSETKLISQLYPDGIICMASALFYYAYSDKAPYAWDIAIDRNASKARFNIDYPYVKPYYVDKAHLGYGVTDGEYEDCTLKIFDKDRLICECVKHENKMDREIFNKAIISYINDASKNITNLLEYAKKRNIHKKVRERIGVWL